MSSSKNPYVLLLLRHTVIGMGKLFPISHKIHGQDLKDYSTASEKLVAVYNVQIYEEFSSVHYPYRFGGPCEPPSTLGELNDPKKSFKDIVAWDECCLASNSSGCDLGEFPRVVRAPVVCANQTQQGGTTAIENTAAVVTKKRKVSFNLAERPKSRVRISASSLLVRRGNPSEQSSSSPVEDDYTAKGSVNNQESNDVRRRTAQKSLTVLAEYHRKTSQRNRIVPVTEQPIGSSLDNAEERHAGIVAVAQQRIGRSLDNAEERLPASGLLTPGQRLLQRLRAAGRSPWPSTPSSEETSSESSIDDHRSDPNWNFSSRGRRKLLRKRGGRNGVSNTRSVVARRLFPSSGANSSRQHAPTRYDSSVIDDDEAAGMADIVAREAVTVTEESLSEQVGSVFGSSAFTRPEQPFLANQLSSDQIASNLVGVNGAGVVMHSFFPKKRKYVFRTRQPSLARKKISALKARRLASASRPDNIFLVPKDCCKLECFRNVDPEYAMRQYRCILRMDREEKKRTVQIWLDKKERKFRFNGKKVCATFLQTAFEISTSLQSSVKGTQKARAAPTALALPREVRRDTVRDRIVTYIRNRAEATGDMMPTRQHVNLPAMNKGEIYKDFCDHIVKHNVIGKNENPPSLNYFYRVWKEEASNIKTRKHHGFTMCTTCEDIRSQMADNHANEKTLAVLREARVEHLRAMGEERRGYAERRDLAERDPKKHCSIILDGADQKSYGLPHFEYKTKSDKGHKLKVKCIGVLEHAKQKSLTLFTMSEEFESGANHVLETAHRVLNQKKAEQGKLPEILFVQADNCTRENKNRYFMTYFQMLVARGVFVEVQVSFLPIGHTHADIDQAFSSVASRLNDNKAVTMNDLLHELRQCYQPKARAGELLRVANLSGLFEETKCVNNVHGFSDYRYFRFTRSTRGIKDGFYLTSCEVKTQHSKPWMPFPAGTGNGFLKFVPDLAKTPPIVTRVPNNVAQVNKCLEAAESRVRNPEKMKELQQLRNRVYTERRDPFHWNLTATFEMNGDYASGNNDTATEESDSDGDSSGDDGRHDIGIAPNLFVAVKTLTDEQTRFWIAKVIEVTKADSHGTPKELKVRWYSAKGSGDPYSAVYEPASKNINGHRRAFIDTVKASTVICRFNQLSTTRRLRRDAKGEIRAALAEQ